MKAKFTLLLILLAAIPSLYKAQSASEQDMMKAWMESITPVEEHKMIASMEGEWKSVNTMWMTPGQPPEKTEGHSINKMIMGGRYMEQKVKGSSMGMPIEGAATYGFDRTKGKFFATWIDNFGTGIMQFEGEKTGDHQITLYANYFDPMTQTEQVHKEVLDLGNKSYTMKYYMQGEGDQWIQSMEIAYTKVK